MRRFRFIPALLALTLMAGMTQAACRQALVLALDVSGSVDEQEYILQLQGLATALEDPAVQQALLEQPDVPVYLSVFEWSGQNYQRLIVDWAPLHDADAIAGVTQRLRHLARAPAPEATSIGGALRYAAEHLTRAPSCWTRTIDVSGDGKNNDWPLPQHIRETAALSGVTINALVIGTELLRNDDIGLGDVAELSAYFTAQIIQGPDAFVEVALGFEDYAAAMTRKLLKELQTAAIGALPPGVSPPAPSIGPLTPPVDLSPKRTTDASADPSPERRQPSKKARTRAGQSLDFAISTPEAPRAAPGRVILQ